MKDETYNIYVDLSEENQKLFYSFLRLQYRLSLIFQILESKLEKLSKFVSLVVFDFSTQLVSKSKLYECNKQYCLLGIYYEFPPSEKNSNNKIASIEHKIYGIFEKGKEKEKQILQGRDQQHKHTILSFNTSGKIVHSRNDYWKDKDTAYIKDAEIIISTINYNNESKLLPIVLTGDSLNECWTGSKAIMETTKRNKEKRKQLELKYQEELKLRGLSEPPKKNKKMKVNPNKGILAPLSTPFKNEHSHQKETKNDLVLPSINEHYHSKKNSVHSYSTKKSHLKKSKKIVPSSFKKEKTGKLLKAKDPTTFDIPIKADDIVFPREDSKKEEKISSINSSIFSHSKKKKKTSNFDIFYDKYKP